MVIRVRYYDLNLVADPSTLNRPKKDQKQSKKRSKTKKKCQKIATVLAVTK